MSQMPTTFFMSDLLLCKIVTAEGKILGHVLDIQVTQGPEYTVTVLQYGRSGLFHRLHLLNPFRQRDSAPPTPETVPWDMVASVENSTVKLKPGFMVDY